MKRPVHALHIGKTGGNALNHALYPYAGGLGIILHGHDWTLADVPLGEGIIFIVRDPIQRFISGFNSRLRRGLPHAFVEWTDAEAVAFSRFGTPTALAEGLVSGDQLVRDAAITAINSIYHPAKRLRFWLGSATHVKRRRNDILWIGVTDYLDEDFSILVRRLGLPESLRLPADVITRHSTPSGFENALTSLGQKAVLDWYADDQDILAVSLELREKLHNADTGVNGKYGVRPHRLGAKP